MITERLNRFAPLNSICPNEDPVHTFYYRIDDWHDGAIEVIVHGRFISSAIQHFFSETQLIVKKGGQILNLLQ